MVQRIVLLWRRKRFQKRVIGCNPKYFVAMPRKVFLLLAMEETTSFKELVPVIEALGNKAMKTRHWSKLADETG